MNSADVSTPDAGPPLRIGVSLFQFLPGRIGGTEDYLRQLLPELTRCLNAEETLHLFGLTENLEPFEQLTDARVIRHVWDATSAAVRRLRGLDLLWPGGASRSWGQRINAAGCQVVLFPQQSIFPRGVTARRVVTIMDLVHRRLPHCIAWGQRWIRWRKETQIAAAADQTIAISEATRTDWLEFSRHSPESCSVVYLGCRPPVTADSENPAAGATPYVYYPAHAYPHKNHAGLLAAWTLFRQQHPHLPGRLILSGQSNVQLQRELDQAACADVCHLGYLTSRQVSAVYRDSRAVVLPTLFEGFGLPLAEGLGYGKSVFCSDLPVFRELAGDSVRYFPPGEAQALANVLAEIFTSPPLPPAEADRQRILERLNWQRCGRETSDLLRAVALRP